MSILYNMHSGTKGMDQILHSSRFRLVSMPWQHTVHFGVNFREHLSCVGPGFSLIFSHRIN